MIELQKREKRGRTDKHAFDYKRVQELFPKAPSFILNIKYKL